MSVVLSFDPTSRIIAPARRRRVLLAATVRCGKLAIPVQIREVSCETALLKAAVIPPAGSQVALERFPVAVSARVISASETSFELSFGERIDPDELLIAIEKAPIEPASKALFPIDHPSEGSACQADPRGSVIPISRH